MDRSGAYFCRCVARQIVLRDHIGARNSAGHDPHRLETTLHAYTGARYALTSTAMRSRGVGLVGLTQPEGSLGLHLWLSSDRMHW